MAIHLVVFFSAREPDFVGVDDDHVIAGIQKRRVGRFILAHQQHSRFAGELAQDHVLGVDDMPLANNAVLGGELGTH